MDGSFLFLFAQSVSGLIASFLFIAIQLFNATATALNCISQICCFQVALISCLAIKKCRCAALNCTAAFFIIRCSDVLGQELLHSLDGSGLVPALGGDGDGLALPACWSNWPSSIPAPSPSKRTARPAICAS